MSGFKLDRMNRGNQMRSYTLKNFRLSNAVGIAGLLLGLAACQPPGHAGPSATKAGSTRVGVPQAPIRNQNGVAIQLTAQRMNTTLRDGSLSPMWGFCSGTGCGGSWAPGPTIIAAAGDNLTINLSNTLPVPTSLVILGQAGGGVGGPAVMNGPVHTGQTTSTFAGNAPAIPFVPPAQGPRVRSFGTEAAAATTTAPGTATLTWSSLKPGTYLYETGTMPSLQAPMGLYGVLVVTTAPKVTASVNGNGGNGNGGNGNGGNGNGGNGNGGNGNGNNGAIAAASLTSGTAYPGVNYDADATLLFSEIDPVQNAAVDAAAVAGADFNKIFNDPSCTTATPCYPAAVNYAPTYFLINGNYFDRTAPQNNAIAIPGLLSSGRVLVRMANAGSRTHIPAIVGLPMSLVAEDGNPLPGKYKIQNEVLLTAGKTQDVLVAPPAAGASYAPNTYPVFDRALSLSTDNNGTGGMQGYLLVNGAAAATQQVGACSTTSAVCASNADCKTGTCVLTTVPVPGAPGNLPSSVAVRAVDDLFAVPCNSTFSGNVTLNDVGVVSASQASQNDSTKGTLTFNPNGTFTYAPAACTGGTDSFTYKGNNNTTNTATVTLKLGTFETSGPVAMDDAYKSALSSRFSAPRPGVLVNDFDPGGYPLTAGAAAPAGGGTFAAAGCGSVSLNPDGSFNVTAAPGAVSCKFQYNVTNSQGLTSLLPATVTVYFGQPSNLVVHVVDAASPLVDLAPADYRWTLQEDLTFKHSLSGTPAVSTRTVGTSFHRSHMPVVATGCVGPVSCGSGQSVRIDNGTVGSNVSALVESSGLVTATTATPQATPFPTQVTISNVTPGGYNGAFQVNWLSPTSFTYQLAAPGFVGASLTVAVAGALPSNIKSVAEVAGVVTITTDGAPLATGTTVTIAGLTPDIYNGTFNITAAGTQYSYTRPVPNLGSGSLVASYSTNVGATLGGRHVMTDAEALLLQASPDQVELDPSKNYYITIFPGDAANPVITAGAPGHTISGAEIRLVNGAWAPVFVKVEKSALTPAQMSIYLYEDSEPTNGQNEPSELPLGGFNVILFDPAGRTGDVAGQNTYDVYNMPLSNALLGRIGCPDTQNTATNPKGTSTCSITTAQKCDAATPCPGTETCVFRGNPVGNSVGEIYTCPNAPAAEVADSNVRTCSVTTTQTCGATGQAACPAGETCLTVAAKRAALDAKYALAGHALIKGVVPARYDVIAHPGAEREGAGEVWWQTETLEGTPAQDAFVGYNEPQYFQEFGPPGPHTTIGFVNPAHVAAKAAELLLTGTNKITGRVTAQHMSHPSNVTLWNPASYDQLSATTCRVVLNSQGGLGPAIAAASCQPDGTFTLAGVPSGNFDIAIFDEWLDQIITNVAVTVPKGNIVATATCGANTVCMGDIPVLGWFTQFDQYMYMDDGNGYDPSKGVSNVPLVVRYRNGAPSNRPLTDSTGRAPVLELFPLFNWYVAEADTTRFKQTGVHLIVDGGGQPDIKGLGAGLWSSKYANGVSSNRTETPGSLTYGLQGFINQRNRVEWGRTPYATGENGGITGTVVLASTRPFDDQRFNVQNIWEPLVPRVTVNLYRQVTLADGTVSLTLVDTTKTSSFDDFVNLVQGLDSSNSEVVNSTGAQGFQLGSDGVLRDPATGKTRIDLHAGIQKNMNCPGQLPGTTSFPWDTNTVDPFTNYTLGGDQNRCYDGWHNWNQLQAVPYDGRYIFPSAAYRAAHPLCSNSVTTNCTTPTDPSQTLVSLPPGTYVVEAVTPPGYKITKEEDKDILIGDAFIAPVTQQFGNLANIFIIPDQATLANANPFAPSTGDPGFQSNPTSNLGSSLSSKTTTFPECVGNLHRVPDYLSLFPKAQQVAPFAGMDRPLCDRKKVTLNDQMQTSASFFIYTEAPVAANNTGIILDDASSEFNAVSPDFGEKASVPFVPISTKDFAGVEISRSYSDQWGAYNLMTPTTWYVNPPTPSGYGPSMLVTCINDPGPIPDPTDPTGKRLITDPKFNPSYSNFCYTNAYMPGQTTYLDTPVLPVAAFASGYNQADCALPDAMPAIQRVDGTGIGPWVPAFDPLAPHTLTIQAQGDQQVPNPAYAGPFAATGLASQHTITRHYGFGATPGSVVINTGKIDPVTLQPITVALTNVSWSDQTISGTVPAAATTGELEITTAAGQKSVDTVTVHVGGPAPKLISGGFAGQTNSLNPGPIQTAIDAATPGDLILIDAGTYNELVVMWKPVQLQGVGAGSVIINAAKYPTSKLETWRPRINSLFSVDAVTGLQTLPSQVDPLPTQEITGGIVVLEPTVLGSEEGAGITVLAKNLKAGDCTGAPNATTTKSTYGFPVTDSNFRCAPSAIDGISVTGGDAGGGIYVNGWAHGLQIGNNRVYGNAGAFNGGIRIGIPYLELERLPATALGAKIPGFGHNLNVRVHHNQVSKNGTVEGPGIGGGAGAGISMCSGSDNYRVDHNYICGNNSQSDGGGIGHLGFSQDAKIDNNRILFNQSFQQTGSTHGGGIFVGGEAPIAGSVTLGTGNLTIDTNVIRGNFAEGGHGGGIRLQQVNGADIVATKSVPLFWHHVTITNNTIDNNVAGWAGGGVSLADALSTSILNNTVVSNDSAGIAGVVLAGGSPLPGLPRGPGPAGMGYPSPSGLVSELTSPQLLAQIPLFMQGAFGISQPLPLSNNVIWQNRSFYYSGNGKLCAGNNANTAGCTVLAPQTTAGSCNKADATAPQPGARYWEIGVLGDTSPVPGAKQLVPIANVLSSITGYAGNTATLSAAQAAGLQQYCNGSRVAPEVPGVLNPPSVKNLQVAATVDEGNNYVNLRYGPLYVENPVTKTVFGP